MAGNFGEERSIDDTAGGTQLFPNLTGRWHIVYENLDATDSIFVGILGVTNTGAGKGAEVNGGAVGIRGKIAPGGAIENPEEIYAIAPAGQTVLVAAQAYRAAD